MFPVFPDCCLFSLTQFWKICILKLKPWFQAGCSDKSTSSRKIVNAEQISLSSKRSCLPVALVPAVTCSSLLQRVMNPFYSPTGIFLFSKVSEDVSPKGLLFLSFCILLLSTLEIDYLIDIVLSTVTCWRAGSGRMSSAFRSGIHTA